MLWITLCQQIISFRQNGQILRRTQITKIEARKRMNISKKVELVINSLCTKKSPAPESFPDECTEQLKRLFQTLPENRGGGNIFQLILWGITLILHWVPTGEGGGFPYYHQFFDTSWGSYNSTQFRLHLPGDSTRFQCKGSVLHRLLSPYCFSSTHPSIHLTACLFI